MNDLVTLSITLIAMCGLLPFGVLYFVLMEIAKYDRKWIFFWLCAATVASVIILEFYLMNKCIKLMFL